MKTLEALTSKSKPSQLNYRLPLQHLQRWFHLCYGSGAHRDLRDAQHQDHHHLLYPAATIAEIQTMHQDSTSEWAIHELLV